MVGEQNVNKMFLDAKKKGVLRVKENKNEVVVVGIEGGHELFVFFILLHSSTNVSQNQTTKTPTLSNDLSTQPQTPNPHRNFLLKSIDNQRPPIPR